jgi:hypothetical protein
MTKHAMLIHRVSSDVAESETQLSTEITGGIKTFQRQFIALSLFFNQIFQTLFRNCSASFIEKSEFPVGVC